jgi:hypothetical protein
MPAYARTPCIPLGHFFHVLLAVHDRAGSQFVYFANISRCIDQESLSFLRSRQIKVEIAARHCLQKRGSTASATPSFWALADNSMMFLAAIAS